MTTSLPPLLPLPPLSCVVLLSSSLPHTATAICVDAANPHRLCCCCRRHRPLLPTPPPYVMLSSSSSSPPPPAANATVRHVVVILAAARRLVVALPLLTLPPPICKPLHLFSCRCLLYCCSCASCPAGCCITSPHATASHLPASPPLVVPSPLVLPHQS